MPKGNRYDDEIERMRERSSTPSKRGDPLMPSSADPDALREVERETGHSFGPPPGQTDAETINRNGRLLWESKQEPGVWRARKTRFFGTYQEMRVAYSRRDQLQAEDPATAYRVIQNSEGYMVIARD